MGIQGLKDNNSLLNLSIFVRHSLVLWNWFYVLRMRCIEKSLITAPSMPHTQLQARQLASAG